jgi:predicted transcriptional regulator
MSSSVIRNASSKRKYRSRTELIASVLECLPELKSRIMYRSELSYTELQDLLLQLERLQLMRYTKNTRLYYITDKGKRYLEIHYRMKDMAEEI